MASVRDLVEVGFDENLVKQAVDAAGFVRTRGRGGLNLNAKDVAKVLKAYNALLAKLTAKVAKFNPDKLNYDEDEAPAPKAKAKAEKKASAKTPKTKPADDEEDDDEPEADDQDDEVEEADDEEDDE
jgi:hypothetical protein